MKDTFKLNYKHVVRFLLLNSTQIEDYGSLILYDYGNRFRRSTSGTYSHEFWLEFLKRERPTLRSFKSEIYVLDGEQNRILVPWTRKRLSRL